MARFSWRHVVAIVGLLLGMAALVGGLIYDQHSSTLPDDSLNPGPVPPLVKPSNGTPVNQPESVTFAVIGDALSGADEQPGQGWVARFAKSMCWTLQGQSGEPDAGYTESADAIRGGRTFAERIPELVEARPDVVIVQGGNNDLGSPPEGITAAAAATFQGMRDAAGREATIVAVGPLASPLEDGPVLTGVTAAIATAAKDSDVVFVDPVGEGWLSNTSFFAEGTGDLNERGDGEFATRLQASLRANGITPTGTCR